jgi:hypothetical protein
MHKDINKVRPFGRRPGGILPESDWPERCFQIARMLCYREWEGGITRPAVPKPTSKQQTPRAAINALVVLG